MTKKSTALKEKFKQTNKQTKTVTKQIIWHGKSYTVCHGQKAKICNIRAPKNQDHYIIEKLSQGINNCISFKKHEKDLLYKKTFFHNRNAN